MKSKTTIWDVLGVIVIILLLLTITVRVISCISNTVQQEPQHQDNTVQEINCNPLQNQPHLQTQEEIPTEIIEVPSESHQDDTVQITSQFEDIWGGELLIEQIKSDIDL